MINSLTEIGKNSKSSAKHLVSAGIKKDLALDLIAMKLKENTQKILLANKKDITIGHENGLSDALIERLSLNQDKINSIINGVKKVRMLADPIGVIIGGHTHPSGFKIFKISVPIGVIAIIYESRPNVTVDAVALCLKSGNSVILRGGKEAINSNKCLVDIMQEALLSAGLPKNCIQLVQDTSRQSANDLMHLSDYVDVLIPRGGNNLIKSVILNASVPVIQTGAGNCHIYVDNKASIEMATSVIFNAKTSRPSVCNAIETVLIHKDIAQKALPAIKHQLDKKNVELRCCPKAFAILGNSVKLASESDWDEEFLDFILAVKVVDNIDSAIEHINKYGSGHSEAIITDDYNASKYFTDNVDAAAIYVNASTRFTDGEEFGMGAEIGISTQKLHARGPMGLEHLTSYKYIINGTGQIR